VRRSRRGQTTLNVVTAGDQNMVDYVNNYLGPKFEAMNPGVKVRASAPVPAIGFAEDLREAVGAAESRHAAWDTDVASCISAAPATMVKEQLLMPYRNDVAAGKLVSRDTAKNALGANVDGYVLPMFHSQIAFAYNPDLVKQPPKSFAELNEWVKKNPEAVRLQRRQGRHVGRRLRHRLGLANSGMADKLEKGPYDPNMKAQIDKALAGLKEFNQYVVMTPGNAGTLDMLNRGEIAMGRCGSTCSTRGPADGKMNPKIKLALPSPGLPGQPMYYVIPAKAAHAALAKKFIDLAESPDVQAEGIVKQFNWYPGIDPQYVQSKMDQAAWNKLFTDISPADLSKYGRPFPLSPYFKEITEGYERVVTK
jgi:ABC-type uncharacterized transport system YnjBCD substrate-binding protein